MQSVAESHAAVSVKVRAIRYDEIPAVAEALVETSAAQLYNRWREQEMGYRELLVAESDGRFVGTVSIDARYSIPDAMHLFALEVAPRLRGLGIGGAIVRFVLDQARRRGCKRVYLEVRADNPARRLYHRIGFRRVGPGFSNAWWRFNDDGTRERIEEDSVRMFKRLAPRD